ncbi:endopeptidase La [Anaerobiospirillum thomasii]|uniref:Lon protease n=1 Tax=Anaerobiospirillum thomasii TaxID=179995 RepID=A0A2X0VC83_9GAMM|nr:endopeptidase La [Anaerobiospirillum thomasii]SPT70485.1 Lon protease 1 [Anaerobiospirillum thomasii]
MSDRDQDFDSVDVRELAQQIGRLRQEIKDKKNKDNSRKSHPQQVHVLPILGRPIMPSQITPVQISPDWQDVLMAAADSDSKTMAVFAIGEKTSAKSKISKEDFPKTGTLVKLLHAKSGEDEIHFICEGLCRVQIESWDDFDKMSLATVSYPQEIVPEPNSEEAVQIKASSMALISIIQELLPLSPLYTDEMRQYLLRFNQNDPSLLADCAASITTASSLELQGILDELDLKERMKLSLAIIKKELKAAKLQFKIKGSVSEKLTKRQKDFFLKEQLKEIQSELGIKLDDKSVDAAEFEKRMKKLSAPEHIQKRFKSELQKLNVLESGSPEYAVTRNYLDVLTTIPWGKSAKEDIDLDKSRAILDKDHEGLDDVKDRIIEFLAVGALKGETKGSIMLFVGPPGVGKTSIGKSIAKALGRPFFRLSLGGVDDESVIKGHRKTYIGAMPGKMVQALRESKTMNPVIMLDEIDKLSRSYQGDPSAALLETLDPEQNNSFLDHYLDEKLDLSDCLFICTANEVNTIPPALLDRMDMIRLSGYISQEKLAIAKKHLLPRALKAAAIKKTQLKLSDTVLMQIIEEYARENGVRSLERLISKIVRKAAVKIVKGEKSVTVSADNLEDFLGSAPFKKERMLQGVGIVTGLAWTNMGGATLPVESKLIHRESKGLTLTGSLGDVMKESASIAYSYVQSSLKELSDGKNTDFFKKGTVHLHVPEGATPKDGPSAGITMASALLSLAINKAPKPNFAMTGELSLTGHVLAIGGIREKVIAARRVGIFDIIVPKANEGDVKELPDEVKTGVNFYYADTFDDVAQLLFKD